MLDPELRASSRPAKQLQGYLYNLEGECMNDVYLPMNAGPWWRGFERGIGESRVRVVG